jgi:hypothetical protein
MNDKNHENDVCAEAEMAAPFDPRIGPTAENVKAIELMCFAIPLATCAITDHCLKCNGPVHTLHPEKDPRHGLCGAHIENPDLVLPEFSWATKVRKLAERIKDALS